MSENDIEQTVNNAIENGGLLFSGIAMCSAEFGKPTLTKDEQNFIAGFHTKKVFMVIKNDDYFAEMRADHFVVEVGFTEWPLKGKWLSESLDYALVTANYKGTRFVTGINLKV